MKKLLFGILFLMGSISTNAQDSPEDYSKISESSGELAYLLSIFSYSGWPKNLDDKDELLILINHGFAVGFSPKMNQPKWAIYHLAKAREELSYDRSQFFVDDLRLPISNRIGGEGYGDGYDRGDMVPNAAISSQFGRLAQAETFLMSNICPQKAGLNQGMWADFEEIIREKYAQTPTKSKEGAQNLWVIVGPIFPKNIKYLDRKNGTKVAIPEAFYTIVVDPYRYPFERPGNSNFLALIFKQDVGKGDNYDDSMITTINEIEYRTNLNFFPEFTDYYENKIESTKAKGIWK